tara:strand:+ start:28 stop:285 length:258 start_codon:yes stop_codon:yes gene_type:complete
MKKNIQRLHESELRQYFTLTKEMFGGKYRKFVEKFIKNKNILNEMNAEEMEIMQKIVYNLDFFKRVQFYQWDGIDNVDEVVEAKA